MMQFIGIALFIDGHYFPYAQLQEKDYQLFKIQLFDVFGVILPFDNFSTTLTINLMDSTKVLSFQIMDLSSESTSFVLKIVDGMSVFCQINGQDSTVIESLTLLSQYTSNNLIISAYLQKISQGSNYFLKINDIRGDFNSTFQYSFKYSPNEWQVNLISKNDICPQSEIDFQLYIYTNSKVVVNKTFPVAMIQLDLLIYRTDIADQTKFGVFTEELKLDIEVKVNCVSNNANQSFQLNNKIYDPTDVDKKKLAIWELSLVIVFVIIFVATISGIAIGCYKSHLKRQINSLVKSQNIELLSNRGQVPVLNSTGGVVQTNNQSFFIMQIMKNRKLLGFQDDVSAVYKQDKGLEDFNLIKSLGQGGFGEAWLVQNKGDNQQYVIKKMQKNSLTMQEISIMQKILFPHIVQYIDSFEDGIYLYLVMEYANGGDLWKMMMDHRSSGQYIQEEHIWLVLGQILVALETIHDNKIMHRDLKPGNVFVSFTDKYPLKIYCVLGDFGLAKSVANSLAMANTVCGTFNYMPPELINQEAYNFKCDVWSLGLIIQELCIRQLAFDAPNPMQLFKKIEECQLEEIPDLYSVSLRKVIKMMLQKEQINRPSVRELINNTEVTRVGEIVQSVKNADKLLTTQQLTGNLK